MAVQSLPKSLNNCVDQMLLVCNEGKSEKLRKIVFETRTTNPFSSIFAILVIAFHELIVRDGKIVADLSGTKKAITNLGARIETSRTATSPDERRKNINTIKGLIGEFFVKAKIDDIYGNHATTDIDSLIRRSETELSDYELKQGLLTLSGQREINTDVIPKVARTLCAMANNGPTRTGKVVIGVTDKDVDAGRIKALDGIEPKKVGKRFVVGVVREAKVLGLSVEDYLAKWKNGIRDSGLSPALGTSVLSRIDYNAYYGVRSNCYHGATPERGFVRRRRYFLASWSPPKKLQLRKILQVWQVVSSIVPICRGALHEAEFWNWRRQGYLFLRRRGLRGRPCGRGQDEGDQFPRGSPLQCA
jgi:hypothetical protein